MPLSTQLARVVRLKLAEAKRGVYDSPEMTAAWPVLKIQSAYSLIPELEELLIEWAQTREGVLYFIYPFAEGLAVIVAHRPGRRTPSSFVLTMNDYGFSLMEAEAGSTCAPPLSQRVKRRFVIPAGKLAWQLGQQISQTDF